MSIEDIKPEKTLSTETIYKGTVITLRVDRVMLPDGREAVREVVEYPKSVVVVPIDADENVIFVRQYRYAAVPPLLELPAGKCEEEEIPAKTAQRELQEEIGYKAGRLQPLVSYWTGPGFVTEYMYAFLAQDLIESDVPGDPDEDILVERFPLDQIHDMIRDRTIQDGKTIATLLVAMHVQDHNSNRRY